MESEITISNAYTKMNHPELLALAATVSSSIKKNPVFTVMWPSQTPDMEKLDGFVEMYREYYEAVEAGDNSKKLLRDNARAAVVTALTKISRWTLVVADDDPTVLATSGFPVKSQKAKSHTHPSLQATGKVTVVHGNQSGVLIVKTDRIAGGVTVELQITDGDPTDENAWGKAGIGIFHTFRAMEVSGLTPGRKYYFRLRVHGTHGVSPWSATVSLYSM